MRRASKQVDWMKVTLDLQVAGELKDISQLVKDGYGEGAIPEEERLIRLLHEALGMLSASNMAQPINQLALLNKLQQARCVRGLDLFVNNAAGGAHTCCNFTNWPNWEFADDMPSALQRNRDAINTALAVTGIYQARKKLEDAYVFANLPDIAATVGSMFATTEFITTVIAATVADMTASNPNRVLESMSLVQPSAAKMLNQVLETGLRQFFRMQMHAALHAPL